MPRRGQSRSQPTLDPRRRCFHGLDGVTAEAVGDCAWEDFIWILRMSENSPLAASGVDEVPWNSLAHLAACQTSPHS